MAANKGNSFRNVTDDYQAEAKPKTQGQRAAYFAWLKDVRVLRVLGATFILFSLFLLLAFTSHIINLWGFETDQDILLSGQWSWYAAHNPHGTANIMGYLGAWFAHLFIHQWFGLASFILLFSIFSLGTKWLFNWHMYPIGKTLRYTFFILVWTSLCMGFIFHNNNLFMGGGFGYFGFMWLKGMIGSIGVALFLLLYASIFAIIVYNFDFRFTKTKPEIDADNSVGLSDYHAEAEAMKQHFEANAVTQDQAELDGILSDEDHVLDITDTAIEETVPLEDDIEESLPTAPIPLAVTPAPVAVPVPPVQDMVLKIETAQEEELVDTTVVETKAAAPVIEGDLYDPTLDLPGFQMPSIDLLQDYDFAKAEVDTTELETSKNLIIATLKNYNIGIADIKANIGPTVTLYEIVPAPGVKISRIKNLEDDIALSLAALGIRIIAPIPGRGTIGIEVPNKKPEMVPMRQMVASKKFQECNFELPVILGKTISNELYLADLSKMPHLLCAGATGQGKSVGLNTLIVSLLYKKHPSELKFVLVDPKKVELTLYNKIERHYLAKLPGDGDAIITDTKLVCNTLNSLCMEMDERYELLKSAGKRNIIEYNTKFKERKLLPTEGHRFLPYIVVVIDEVADLMMTAGREVETPIARLAQLARAVGIHVILATQRPSVNIITGTIKANFPARLAFRVTSKIDSRTILDSNGADQLIGKGDMLYSTGNDLIRLQCPFVDTPEVERITEFIGNQRGYSSAMLLPEFKSEEDSGREDFDPNERDALFEEAARLVVMTQQGSTSLIQRKLKLGYNRAGRLVDQMEQAGILGPFEGAKARKVLIPDEVSLQQFLDHLYGK